MIKVTVVDPDDAAWHAWKTAADSETLHAKKAKGNRTYKVNADLYKQPRDFLLDAFHDKCGYCETKIDAPDRRGDVDHFRPKGRVTGEDHSVVLISSGPKARPHPGYYWLIYDWTNFIPSCPGCNRPGEDRDGLKSGKWDKFPLGTEFRAVEPGDEVREQPLLINPRAENPDDHLEFDPVTGVIGYKTLRGEATVRILGLNRRGLPEARRQACDWALALYKDYEDALRNDASQARLDELEAKFVKCRQGAIGYAAFVRASFAVADEQNEIRRKKLDRLFRG